MATSRVSAILQQLRRNVLLLDGEELTDVQLLECFINRRDRAALEALVRRHGPMVWAVCRRLLRNHHDVEDAFQVTFLVLVRKARSIASRALLANWLYGVARQTALKARQTAAKRREKQVTHMPETEGEQVGQSPWGELQPLLDQELSRLSEKYRIVLILCDMEGKSRREAARQLGLPEGTVASRLARARRILAERLTRRGVAVSCAPLAALLAEKAASANVPAVVISSTIQAANLLAEGQALAGLVPASVQSLTEGVMKAMLLSKLKTGILIALIALALASGLIAAGQKDEKSKDDPPAKKGEAPARRDPEGEPLPAGARLRLGTTQLRHEDRVWRVAFTPDGRSVVSSSKDGTVRLWDLASGREVRRFGDSNTRGAVALSPDGKILVVNGGLWDLHTGRALPPLEEVPSSADGSDALPENEEGEITFTADSRTLVRHSLTLQRDPKAIRGDDFSDRRDRVSRWVIRVDFFDVGTGKRLRHADVPPLVPKEELNFAQSKLSPDGKLLAVFNRHTPRDNVLHILDTATGKEVATFSRNKERIRDFGFAPDGKKVATVAFVEGSFKHSIRVWDVATGKNTLTLNAGGMVQSVLYSPDGNLLAANMSHPKEQLLLWDLKADKVVGHLPGVVATAFSPDGKVVASALGNTVGLWEVPSGKELYPFAGHRTGLLAVACAPDGRTITTDDASGRLCLWQADTGRLIHAFPTHYSFPFTGNISNRVVLSPDGRMLAASGPDSVTKLWDVATSREVLSITGPGLTGWPLAFSPDGRVIAVGAFDTGCWISLRDAATGREISRTLPHGSSDHVVAFSPDGRLLAATGDGKLGAGKVIQLWDVASGRLVRQWQGAAARAGTLAFSPDGRCLAAASANDRVIRVWETATGLERCRLAGHADGVRAVAFSPDGRCLASAGCDGTTRVWDWLAGRERSCLRGHTGNPTRPGHGHDGSGGVGALAFTPDGRGLVTGGEDATVVIWDVPSEPRVDERELADEELWRLWVELATGDGHRVQAAVANLVRAGDRAVRFLEGRLKEPEAVPARVRQLLAELDAEEFEKREAATLELEKLGLAAKSALRATLAAGPSAEVRSRLVRLLKPLEGKEEALTAEQRREVRGVEALELAGTAAARDVLRQLAKRAPETRLAREARESLERLAKRGR